MGNSSKIGTSIFISAILSMILIAGAGYFILPLIYPNINQEINGEPEETPNILLQSKHIDASTQLSLNDDQLDYVKINDTELSITTQGNSSLAVLFTMNIILRVDPSFAGYCLFEIAIVIDGIGNRTIVYEISRASASIIQDYSEDITINYITGVISSGTYTVEALWRSAHDATGTNNLRSYYWSSDLGMYINDTRTLWAQELR